MHNDDVTQEIIENWIANGEWQFCVEAGRKAVDGLIRTLNGDNLLSRIEAARALGIIGDNKAMESLLVALSDHDTSVYFRDRNKNLCIAAAEALGLIGDPKTVQALINELKNTHDNVRALRQTCADALVKIGLPAVEALVIAMTFIPEDEFQREVQGDIARILFEINEPVSSQAAHEVLRKLEIVARCTGSVIHPEHSKKVEKPVNSIEPAVAEELHLIQDRLIDRQCKPSEHYVDAGYMSGPNLAHSRDLDIDLIGPLPEVKTPQDLLPNGITQAQFQMDLERKIATCPQGHQARNPSLIVNTWSFHFPQKVCAACSLHDRCCTGKGGRTVGMNIHYDLVQTARVRQKTDAFKKDYQQHRSGVEGSLSALVRGHGMRVSRYNGHKKRNVQAIFTGCAANLKRTASWLSGDRPQVRHPKSWTLTSP